MDKGYLFAHLLMIICGIISWLDIIRKAAHVYSLHSPSPDFQTALTTGKHEAKRGFTSRCMNTFLLLKIILLKKKWNNNYDNNNKLCSAL